MTLEQLIGSLMAYEVQKNERDDQESNKNSIALKVESISEESELDEELALITKKFKKFLKKGKPYCQICRQSDQKSFTQKKDNQEIQDVRTCFNCKKPNHMVKDCPLMKTSKRKDEKKKRAFQAKWDQSDYDGYSSDSSDEEEVANMYFMAVESEVSELNSDFSFDELNDAFNDLYERYSNICHLNKTYKKQIFCLENDISAYIESKNSYVSNIEYLMHDNEVLNAKCDELLSQNTCYINDITVSNKKIVDQDAIIYKFTSGRDN